MRYLVTGDAGFIGFHVARRLLADGHEVLGIDALTDYYDVNLKHRRRALLAEHAGYRALTLMLEQEAAIAAAFAEFRPETVIHLAAQAGVRHSLEAPRAYLSANITGGFNILEAARRHPPGHLLIASTSSAYGANDKFPFVETDAAAHPVSLYAATKGAGELIAHCYAHLHALPITAFRFFTVYGPWGRPDMAYFLFTRAILEGRPIELFNNGESWRDFTFIDDLVESILRLAALPPPLPGARAGVPPIPGDSLSPVAPYRLVNIGAGRPVKLTDFVAEIEKALGRSAERVMKPLPAGDMVRTYADAGLLLALTGQTPATPLSVGIPQFVEWYRRHYN